MIYFSILNYIKHTHGFDFEINFNYDLISPDRIKKSYIEKNFGRKRLKQIKYKYFSDKALRIWDLCYAFFDREYKIAMNHISRDYLLAKDFDHVFEVMIDTLIGETDLPKDLKKQKDGKMVDHMFIGQGLIEQANIDKELTYYIGDSKYYKRVKDGVNLGEHSIYKQYTYAKNVVQWNMDLFLDEKDSSNQPQLRDKLTEGYNPIPNFFISARIPTHASSGDKFLSFDDYELKTQEGNVLFNRQFENRLFDRDTLLLCHYDVNFLFLVSLYGRNNKSKQSWWRDYIRAEFRKRIQSTLNRLYTFRIIWPRPDMDCYQFIKNNFHLLNGKIYRPHIGSQYLVLALMKTEQDELTRIFRDKARDEEMAANEQILSSIRSHFEISEPFVLKENINVSAPLTVGSIEQMPHVVKDDGLYLFGIVNKYRIGSDSKKTISKEYLAFYNHEAVEFIMRNMPGGDISQIKYFVPMFDGGVAGYYEITGITFGSRKQPLLDDNDNPVYDANGEEIFVKMPCLNIRLGAYTPFGDHTAEIPKFRNWNGQIHTYAEVMRLYQSNVKRKDSSVTDISGVK